MDLKGVQSEFFLKVLESPKPVAETQSLSITSFCYETEFYSQLPFSELYIIMILGHRQSKGVTVCSNKSFTAYHLGTDLKALKESFEIARDLIRSLSKHPNHATVYITNQESRKLADTPSPCKPFYFLNAENECESCPEGCSKCSDAKTCIECYPGTVEYYSYWMNSTGHCNYCNWYECLTCKTDSICEICMPGYKNVDNKCQKCDISDCKECDTTGCLKCLDGFYLETGKGCKPCVWGCSECTDGASCVKCHEGTYIDNTKKSCSYCSSNCTLCSSDTGCEKCDPGYLLSNGKCESCPWLCELCDTLTTCSKCQGGHYLDAATKCRPCTDIYCEICNNDKCSQCFDGTYLNSENNKCTPCPKNCDVCDEQGLCIKCSNGPVVEGECLECGKNCELCDLNQCNRCDDGYFFIKGEQDCQPCETGCRLCSQNECHVCENDFYEHPDSKKCVPCSNGCSFCYTLEKCDHCYEGFFLNPVTSDPSSIVCKPCPSNCIECSEETICKVCKEGFIIDAAGQCSNCAKGCAKCLGGVCKSCFEGFYLEQETCSLCSYSCKWCLAYDNCQECTDGFFLNKDSKFCDNCPSFCESCDSSVCFKCQDKFFLEKDGKCQPCPYGCLTCENATKCDKCAEGLFLNSTTASCKECMPNCLLCKDDKSCGECYMGFYLKENKCLRCEEGCRECDYAGDCVDCQDGFYLEDGLCLRCLEGCTRCQSKHDCSSCNYTLYLDSTTMSCEQCMSNCDICNDEKTCSWCSYQFYIDATATSVSCSKCPQNCDYCSATSCYFCSFGYYLDDTDKCVSCPGNCASCYTLKENSVTVVECAYCDEGYGKYKNTCIKCPENCGFCSEGLCLNCTTGYYLSTSGICYSCDSNCRNCAGPNKCFSCDDGYEVDKNTGLCSACRSNCLTCDSSKFCIQCKDNFYVSKTGDCVNCPFNCISCTAAVCLQCEASFYINTYGKCSYCSYGCSNCQSSEICSECYLGFYLDIPSTTKAVCVSCGRGCNSCDKTGCLDCQEGHYLALGECFECYRKFPGCSYCTNDQACEKCYDGLKLSDDKLKCLPCSEGCLSCYNDVDTDNNLVEVCFVCSTSYVLVGTKCTKCSVGCLSCDSPDKCNNCISYYYLDSSGFCSKCPNNCWLCQDSSTCSDCDYGYSWNKVNRVCAACATGCSECKDGICNTCFYGLYLDDKTKSCKYCQPNCAECTSLTFCKTCYWNFYFDETQLKCLPCAKNCYECSSASKCIYCYYGFTAINGVCQPCPSNCASCDAYGCSYCHEGFYLNANLVCTACKENCSFCSSTDCHVCRSRHYLDSTTKACLKCTISNCLYCDQNSCNMCDQGFALISNACVQCPANCYYCEKTTTCLKCFEGFYPNTEGVCTVCSDPGCSWCNSKNFCEQCRYGYSLNKYEGKCVRCPDFCVDCNSDGSCNTCQEGAFPDEKTGKCFMCPDYCARCKSFTSCDECASNYIQNIDGTCTPCMRDCLQCKSKDTCLQCGYGTFLDTTGKCKQCENGCLKCDRADLCFECGKGYFLTENRCKKCSDPGCLTCNQNTCTECVEGFYLNTTNSTCMPCTNNCLRCTDLKSCSYCNQSYYLNSTSNTCNKCAANCLQCPDSQDCNFCDTGYVLSNDAFPRKCRKCPGDCEECNSTTCHKCSPGFYLNEFSKCNSCGGNCAECQKKGICNVCFNGFYLDSTANCGNCPAFCSKCKDGQTCDECDKGYILQPELVCTGCPLGCTKCDDSKACYSCSESFLLENTTCSKCSIPTVVKASISKSYTSLTIEFLSLIDLKLFNCKSAVSTLDSFGMNWNCSVSGKNLTVNFDTDYLLSDSSIIFVATDFVFVKPCSAKMTYNFTASFQVPPPMPKAQLKGTPSASLGCSEGNLEYVLDGVGGTAGMMPKIKWYSKIFPEDPSINEYISALNGTRISIPTKIFKKVSANLTVVAEITNPMKKAASVFFVTQLIGAKKMTVLIDAGTALNFTTSKEYSFTAKVDNACGADDDYSYSWNLTFTTNPSTKYVLGPVPTIVPHRLKLAAFTLDPFHYYVYTVTASAGTLSGSASIKIYGLAEDLVVVFDRKDGNISPLMDLIVDASQSYDPNKLGFDLIYSWSCIDPKANKTCTGADGKTLVSNENSAVLNIPATRLPAGQNIQLFLLLRSAGDTRKSQDSVTFFVYKGLSTNIQMTFNEKKVEPSNFLYLNAIVTSQADYTLKWTQLQGTEISLTPDDMPSLFFTPKTFNKGETYEFLLTATETLTGAFATASVEFKANVPASCLNSLSISAEKGVALTDVFTLSIDSCSDGDEEDPPLTYTFFIMPSDFSGVFITKPQQFSSVGFKIFEGSFFAGVRVCDQLWGCTWKYLDSFFYVSAYQGRRLNDDPITVYKNLIKTSSDATILYGISIINTFELTAEELDYVCGDASDYAQTEEIDLDTVEMMLKLYIQTVINQASALTAEKIQGFLDELVGLTKNCTEELSSDIMDSFRLLAVEIMKLNPINLEYVNMVNSFYDQIFKIYSANILPGNIIANHNTDSMLYYKYRDISSNYKEKQINFDGGISVYIESLSFNETDLIDINVKSFPDTTQFSDMLEITFTRCGSYINKALSKSSEEVVALTTPSVVFGLPRHKNATGSWTCQYYTEGSWKSDGCDFEREEGGIVYIRISHTSLFRLYDSELVPSSDDGGSSRHYGPVILSGLLTLILMIGYTASRFIDKYQRKKNKKIAVEVNKVDNSQAFERIEPKDNDMTVVEPTPRPENQFIKSHLIFGLFTYDSRFTKSDRVLALCLILATQFTLEGAMIGYNVVDVEWVSTMVAVAVISVVLTIPIHIVVNLNMRHISGRFCRVVTVFAFILFVLNVALTVAIAVDLTSRHTTWIISFFWGLLFESILEGVFMISKYVISRA